MSRFAGFQNEVGVAVLDTVSGELVLYLFDGSAPRRLREPIDELGTAPRRELPARPGGEGHASRGPVEAAEPSGFRPARRLEEPRPMVIRYPNDEEVAAFKAARLASSGGEYEGSGGGDS